jgi:hypothetical protein
MQIALSGAFFVKNAFEGHINRDVLRNLYAHPAKIALSRRFVSK